MLQKLKRKIISFFDCVTEKPNTNTIWKLTCCGQPIDFSRSTHVADQDQEIFYETICRNCGKEFDLTIWNGQYISGNG